MATKKQLAQESNDLEILHPNTSITVGGKDVVVREYGFVEGARLAPLTRPIVEDIKRLFKTKESLSIGDISHIASLHIETIVKLLSVSTGEDEEWINNLSQSEGTTLIYVWWSVNGPFYVEKAVSEYQLSKGVEDETL